MENQGFLGKFLVKDKILSSFSPIFPKNLLYFQSAVIDRQVQFADISFYQGAIDWAKYKQYAHAAIIRAGQNLWIDPKFGYNYSEAKRLGIKRGIYWFYDSRISPDQQANLLINLIKSDLPEMEVFCDWEYNYGGNYFDLSNAVKFMKKVDASVPGVKVGMYTGYYFFKDHTNPNTHFVEYDYLKNKPLWLAWYTSNPAYVQIPAPWTNLTHWQYTSTGDGKGWGAESSGLDLNWFNGTVESFNQKYGGTVVTPPSNGGTTVGEIIYNNGVKVITGRMYDSDFRTTVIPYASLSSATFEYSPGKCDFVESLDGYDYLCNFTPFTQCKPNMGLRIDGYEYEPYRNYNPYLVLDSIPFIDHTAKQFRNYKTASQAFRYIIENSAKNPLSNTDWNNVEPRRLVGTLPNGSLISISVSGRDGSVQRGWTLHEAAEYGLSLGLNMMVDADSGSSVQEYLVVDGAKKVTTGISTYRGKVAVFMGIKFKTPIKTGTNPPIPGVTKTHDIDVMSDGSLVIDGVPYP